MKDDMINKETQKDKILPPYLTSYAVTRKCNLNCKHCYSDATNKVASDELSTKEAKRLLDDIASLGVKLIIFDGGEPLCRDDFFDIAKYASLKGLRVVIGSNGTLIGTYIAKKLKSSGVMAVQISIDSANPKKYDWFRGMDGSFNKALKGAFACRESKLSSFNNHLQKRLYPDS